jgi:hypothetical protein
VSRDGDNGSESAENSTKKTSLPVCGNEAFERPRRDLNPQPPDRQSGDAEIEPLAESGVTTSADKVSATVSPSDAKTADCEQPTTHDSFSAALAMIAALPLSSNEKAEAVRKLLWSTE